MTLKNIACLTSAIVLCAVVGIGYRSCAAEEGVSFADLKVVEGQPLQRLGDITVGAKTYEQSFLAKGYQGVTYALDKNSPRLLRKWRLPMRRLPENIPTLIYTWTGRNARR